MQSALVDDKDAKIKSEHIDLPEQELPVKIENLTPDTLSYYDGTYIVRLSIPYNGITIFLPLLIPSLALSFVIAFSLCSPFNV